MKIWSEGEFQVFYDYTHLGVRGLHEKRERSGNPTFHRVTI